MPSLYNPVSVLRRGGECTVAGRLEQGAGANDDDEEVVKERYYILKH